VVFIFCNICKYCVTFLISKFCRVLHAVIFLWGHSPAFEFCVFHLHRWRKHLLTPSMKMKQSVPKLQHIKYRRRGITQNKEYSIVLSITVVCGTFGFTSFAWFSGASYYDNEYVRTCVFIQKRKLYLFINFPICVIICYLLIVYLMPGIRC